MLRSQRSAAKNPSDPISGIGRWTKEELVAYLRTRAGATRPLKKTIYPKAVAQTLVHGAETNSGIVAKASHTPTKAASSDQSSASGPSAAWAESGALRRAGTHRRPAAVSVPDSGLAAAVAVVRCHARQGSGGIAG